MGGQDDDDLVLVEKDTVVPKISTVIPEIKVSAPTDTETKDAGNAKLKIKTMIEQVEKIIHNIWGVNGKKVDWKQAEDELNRLSHEIIHNCSCQDALFQSLAVRQKFRTAQALLLLEKGDWRDSHVKANFKKLAQLLPKCPTSLAEMKESMHWFDLFLVLAVTFIESGQDAPRETVCDREISTILLSKIIHEARFKQNPVACTVLGWCYFHGVMVEKSMEEAEKLWNNPDRKLSSARGLYWWARELEKTDSKRSLVLFEEIANVQDHPPSQNIMYVREKDEIKDRLYLKLSAKQGYIIALVNSIALEKDSKLKFQRRQELAPTMNISNLYKLGYAYEEGIGTEKDCKKALETYWEIVHLLGETTTNASSRKPLSNAHFAIGWWFEHGLKESKLEIDHKKALHHYLISAQLGHVEGMYCTAWMYEKGKDVEHSPLKCFDYYLRAANKDHVKAQRNVAWCFKNAYGTVKDNVKAREWYQRAMNGKDDRSKVRLASMIQQGIGGPKDVKKAFEMYQQVVETTKENEIKGEALYFLAWCYEEAIGVDKDEVCLFVCFFNCFVSLYCEKQTKAIQLYTDAWNLEKVEAAYRLGLFFKKTRKTNPEDMLKSISWLKKSVDKGNDEAKKALRDLFYELSFELN